MTPKSRFARQRRSKTIAISWALRREAQRRIGSTAANISRSPSRRSSPGASSRRRSRRRCSARTPACGCRRTRWLVIPRSSRSRPLRNGDRNTLWWGICPGSGIRRIRRTGSSPPSTGRSSPTIRRLRRRADEARRRRGRDVLDARPVRRSDAGRRASDLRRQLHDRMQLGLASFHDRRSRVRQRRRLGAVSQRL